jgi:glutamate racemase
MSPLNTRKGGFMTLFKRKKPSASAAAPELVSAIESKKGVDSVLLERELAFLDGGGTDTVILGCTHFAAIESEIRKRGYNTVNSARIGAEMLACRAAEGRGVTLYINK